MLARGRVSRRRGEERVRESRRARTDPVLTRNLYLTYAKLSALEEKLSSLENEVKGLERDVSNALYYSQRATDAAAGPETCSRARRAISYHRKRIEGYRERATLLPTLRLKKP